MLHPLFNVFYNARRVAVIGAETLSEQHQTMHSAWDLCNVRTMCANFFTYLLHSPYISHLLVSHAPVWHFATRLSRRQPTVPSANWTTPSGSCVFCAVLRTADNFPFLPWWSPSSTLTHSSSSPGRISALGCTGVISMPCSLMDAPVLIPPSISTSTYDPSAAASRTTPEFPSSEAMLTTTSIRTL